MGKRRRNYKQKKHPSRQQNLSLIPKQEKSMEDIVMDELIKATKSCDTSFIHAPIRLQDRIKWYIQNLPTYPYVREQWKNFLFSNGLTTGDPNLDPKVDKFLYRHNIQGVTNYSVIQEGCAQAREYGKCGIRWLSEEDGIVLIPSDQYVSLVVQNEQYKGFEQVIAYAISVKNEPIAVASSPFKLDEDEFYRTGRLITENEDIFIETPDNFCNLRNDNTTENGVSCFDRDKQRLNLLSSVYERLNYDIVYDGPGRIILRLKDSYLPTGQVDLSASSYLESTEISKESRADKAIKEAEALANKIKNSSSDNVLLLSPNFEDNIEHLERVTKATEFFTWLNKEGSIVAQAFGITPELIGLGDVSGNVSMEKIIDNAMVNTIIPLRESFATQFSPMLSAKLGVPKLYFDKYELQYNVDRSSERYKDSLSVAQLVTALTEKKDGEQELSPDLRAKVEEALSRVLDHIIEQT